jgi:Sulfotransferase domain/Uncharacterized protein conserved in bacteria (DUF2169)
MSAWQVPVASAAGAASRTIPWRSNGQLRLTVLTKAAFDFEPNGSMKLSASTVDEIAEGDVPAGEDPSGSVRNASDLVPFKPRVDATCWGYAYAPGGIPIPRLQARIAIANQTGITFGQNIDDPAHVISTYERHNLDVIQTIPKNRLLIFEAHQGWEPLCRFLGQPIPNMDFPHVNSSEEFVSSRPDLQLLPPRSFAPKFFQQS